MERPNSTATPRPKQDRHERLPRKRTVTIGGSDPLMTSKETTSSRGNGDSLPREAPQPSPHGLARRTAQLNLKEDSTQSRTVNIKTVSKKRPYPPTSWKSTSTIDSSGSSMIENLKSHEGRTIAGANGVVDKNIGFPSGRSIQTQDSFVDDAVSTESLGLANHTASGRSSRTTPRRHYTITSSKHDSLPPVLTSKNTRSQTSAASDRTSIPRATLPHPEAAYANTFHYTTCPHTSPPKSRPLNVQPTLVPYQAGLLSYPPTHLREYQTESTIASPNIYTILGACSDCDLSAHRQAESKALDSYTDKLENLSIQLSMLHRDISADHDESLSHRGNSISAFELPSTLDLAPEATQAILEIEDQLDQLIRKRDREVKHIWKGFTARWGPGTTQIRRDDSLEIPSSVSSRAPSRARSQTGSATTTFSVSFEDQIPERTSTMTPATSTGTNKAPGQITPSRQSSFAKLARASSAAGPRERYSDGTHEVVVGPSVDGIEARGRMRVNWIRPERRETNGQGGLSRKSSRHGN